MAAQRIALIGKLPILVSNTDVHKLVKTYALELGLTGKARGDLPHFAFCVAYEVDYLVTWNCAHLANAIVLRRLHDIYKRLASGCLSFVLLRS